MNYDCILVNGDSYSAPTTHRVYSDFLSDQLSIPVKNFAIAGSNNQRILRTSIEYLSQVKQEYQKPLVIVGWTFIRRLEIWYNGTHQKLLTQIPDHPDSRFVSLDWLSVYNELTPYQKALMADDSAIHKPLMDFYTNLYMLARTLESQNISYRFFSAADNSPYPVTSFPYLNSLEQVKWVVGNPNIFKLHEFSIANWAKKNDPECMSTGHLSESGHSKFARYLLDNLIA